MGVQLSFSDNLELWLYGGLYGRDMDALNWSNAIFGGAGSQSTTNYGNAQTLDEIVAAGGIDLRKPGGSTVVNDLTSSQQVSGVGTKPSGSIKGISDFEAFLSFTKGSSLSCPE